MFEGIAEHLQKGIKALPSDSLTTKTIAPAARKYDCRFIFIIIVYIWISKNECDEAVHLLCTKNAHKILMTIIIWYLCLFCDVIKKQSCIANTFVIVRVLWITGCLRIVPFDNGQCGDCLCHLYNKNEFFLSEYYTYMIYSHIKMNNKQYIFIFYAYTKSSNLVTH